MSDSPTPLVVQSLIGKKQVDFYIRCLNSLLENCQEQIELLLHSDGSLTEEDQFHMLSKFEHKKVSFSKTKDSAQKTLDQLRGRPNCQKFRKESIWGMEFFDPLFANTDDSHSFYIDADILFRKPFKGLFDREVVKGGAIFLRDIQWDAYAIRPWHLFSWKRKLKIVHGITTALVCWDKRVIDWDYLEWFLGLTSCHKIPEWVMPTAQAGLAVHCNSKAASSDHILNMYPNAKIKDETFGFHLLGSFRKQWLPKMDQYIPSGKLNLSPLEVRFENCKVQTAIGYGINQARRWVNTRLNKW